MYLKSFGLVFAVVTLVHCSRAAEIGRNEVEKRVVVTPEAQLLSLVLQQPISLEGLKALVTNKEVFKLAVESILRSQGTSLEQLHERLAESGGNLETIIAAINAELRIELLVIDSDLIKINSKSVAIILSSSIEQIARIQFQQNPLLGTVVANVLTQQIKAKIPELQLDSRGIPVNAVRDLIAICTVHSQRLSKRSLTGDIFSSLTDVILSVFRGQVSGIVKPIKINIDNALLNITDALLKAYTSVEPKGEIEAVLAYVKNTVIKKLVEYLTVARTAITSFLEQFVIEDAAARRRRDVGDNTELQLVHNVELQPDGSNGIVDIIMTPIRAILRFFLRPINSILKSIATNVIVSFVPTVGHALLDPLLKFILRLIDSLIPTFQ